MLISPLMNYLFQVSFCTNIGIFVLGKNRFFGNLPRDLENMQSLVYLDLHDNNMTGNFPEFLSYVPELQVLSLRNNSLHRSLPSKAFSWLRILDLLSNNPVGIMPSEWGNLMGMTGISFNFLAYQSFDNEVEVNYVESTISSSIGMFNFKMEITDLLVNWKNALRGLSRHY